LAEMKEDEEEEEEEEEEPPPFLTRHAQGFWKKRASSPLGAWGGGTSHKLAKSC
jgi:hypothetical protein